MAASKFGGSTKRDNRYKPKVAHPDKYETYWGTRGTQSSKRTWSVRHSTHPVIAWANDIKKLAVKIGTPDEFDAAQRVIDEVSEISQDFKGVRRWTLRIASAKLQFEASIMRL